MQSGSGSIANRISLPVCSCNLRSPRADIHDNCDDVANKIRRLPKSLEAKGQRRNASLGLIPEETREDLGAVHCVKKSLVSRPIRQIDFFLDASVMEVAVRKRIERVASETPIHKPASKTISRVARTQKFINHGLGQPQPSGQRMPEAFADGNRVSIQSRFDLGDRSAWMNIGAITEWKFAE